MLLVATATLSPMSSELQVTRGQVQEAQGEGLLPFMGCCCLQPWRLPPGAECGVTGRDKSGVCLPARACGTNFISARVPPGP